MTKYFAVLLVALFSLPAAAAQRCIHFTTFPTLTCVHGFHPKQIKSHCWACVPNVGTHDADTDSEVIEVDPTDALEGFQLPSE